MTLLLGHELATGLATLSAMLAVLLGEQMTPLAWAATAAVPAGLWARHAGRGLSTSLGGFLALASVLWGVLFILQEGLSSALLGAGYALLLLCVVRLFNRETPAHDIQLYALSLLLILDAAALNISWLYAPCFLAYTVSIVWALTTRELKRAAEDEHRARAATGEPPLWREGGLLSGRFFLGTGVMSVVVLGGTLLLFVVFPRVGLGMLRLGGGGQKSGFSDTVRLGEGGSISQDFSVVMRVRDVDGGVIPTSLYFRGAAYDSYDGNTWTRSEKLRGDRRGAAHMPRGTSNLTRYRVTLDPSLMPFVFTAGAVSRLTVRPSARILSAPLVPFRDGLGDLILAASPGEPVVYEVDADIRPVDFQELRGRGTEYPLEITETYLDTSGVPASVRELATTWSAGQDGPLGKVAAISARLGEFSYTLEDEAPPPGMTPLEHFLFNRRAGHCEYFATALALMSRSVGVPARMAGGFQGGARHPAENYVVMRQADAHAWTEVFVPGTGWVPVDATPGQVLARPPLTTWAHMRETMQRMWEEYVVDFSLGTQIDLAQGAGAWLSRLRAWRPAEGSMAPRALIGGVAGGLGLVAAWLLVRRFRRGIGSRGGAAARLRKALHATTVRLVGAAPETATVREWSSDAGLRLSAEDARVLEDAARAFEVARYGGVPLSPAEEDAWVRKVEQLRAPA